jgi:hypothetical protein
MITLSTPNDHPNALLSKCCHCFHQTKIMVCKIKTVEASSKLQYGAFFYIICATLLLAYKTFYRYLCMVCTALCYNLQLLQRCGPWDSITVWFVHSTSGTALDWLRPQHHSL